MNRPNPTIVGFLNKKSLFDTDNEARNVSPIKKHVRANTQYFAAEGKGIAEKSRVDTGNNCVCSGNRTINELYAYTKAKRNWCYGTHTRKVSQLGHDYYKIGVINEYKKLRMSAIPKTDHEYNIRASRYCLYISQTPPKHTRFYTNNQIVLATVPKTHSRNFYTSKLYSKICLYDLHQRVSAELNLLEKTIRDVASSLENNLYRKLHELKTEITRVIEYTFREVYHNMDRTMQEEKDERLKEIIQMKYKLKEREGKLKEMKYYMDSNWRKVAGELLANDIDGKIDAVIVESSELREKIAATVLVGTSGSRVEKKGNYRLPTYLLPVKELVYEMINKVPGLNPVSR